MGMPVITPGTGARDQAITDLIQSVALQETAVSHILNADADRFYLDIDLGIKKAILRSETIPIPCPQFPR